MASGIGYNWIERLLKCTAFGLVASTLVGAWHDSSQAWDVWYYHLPFAARLADIVPKSLFVFDSENEARFQGFPLLGELLQGWLWRLTGRPEAANLVAFSSVPLFALFLRWRFGVPIFLSVLGLFAVPLVQLHMTSCYVDLPANTALAALILLTLEAYVRQERPNSSAVALAVLAAAFSANLKMLLLPIVLAALTLFGIRALALYHRSRALRTRARKLIALGTAAFALALVLATPLRNLVRQNNPFYPLDISILGHHYAGTEQPYASSPNWLASAPRPLRFAASVLEIRAAPLSDRHRWTMDQWAPSDSPSYRMGGFFGAYVVWQLALFAYLLTRMRSRDAWTIGGGFALITVLTSVLPQSHELRYYMVWMIVLTALNLWLVPREPLRKLQGIVAVVATGIVVVVTHGGYVRASGSSFSDLVHEKVNRQQIARLESGSRICVTHQPYNLLWAPTFHSRRDYVVKSVDSKLQCGDYRPIE
jgi:hypothetical protein